MPAHWEFACRRSIADCQRRARAGVAESFLCRANSVVPRGFAANARVTEGIARRRIRLRWETFDANEPSEYRQRTDSDHPRRGPAEHRLLSQTQDARRTQPAFRSHERRLWLHPDEGGLQQFQTLRLRLADESRRAHG